MRYRAAAAASCALAVLLVSACSTSSGAGGTSVSASGASTSGAKSGGTLVMLAGNDFANLDPIDAYTKTNRQLSYATTRYLFAYADSTPAQSQTVLHPDIATEIPTKSNGGISADGKTITVKIRQGVDWSTTPARQVTAQDFVREFKMLCNPDNPVPAPGYYTSTIVGMSAYCAGFAKVSPTVSAMQDYVDNTPLSGVQAANASTLVFHLITPTSDFLNILAMEFSAARPVEYMKYLPDSKGLRQHLLADGPYMITSYDPGVSMDLARNPNWKASTDSLRHAYLDKIDIKFGVSPTNAQEQIQAGTADLGLGLSPTTALLPSLISSDNPDLIISPPAGTNYLTLNTLKGPMSNLLVREAVDAAVNKKVIQQLGGGPKTGEIANQIPLPGSSGYVANLKDPLNPTGAGDVAKAKQLLAQAGYSSGVKVTLAFSEGTGSQGTEVAQAYQSSLQQAGFDVILKPLTGAIFTNDYMRNPSAAEKDLWDIAITGWGPDWKGNNGRAAIVPELSNPGAGSVDYSGYNSPAFNSLVAKALSAASAAQANTYWQQASAQSLKDLPIIPILYVNDAVYHSSRLQGCVYLWNGRSCALPDVWLN